MWAAPKLASLKAHLRAVHADPEEALRRGRQGRRDMVEKYSLEAVGALLKAEMERISEELSVQVQLAPGPDERGEL